MKHRVVIVSVILVLCCGNVFADEAIRIEAEEPLAYEDLGYTSFDPDYYHSGASGSHAVEHFDYPGQWFEVLLAEESFPREGTLYFSVGVRSAGLNDLVRIYYLDFKRSDTGTIVASDTIVTGPGQGHG